MRTTIGKATDTRIRFAALGALLVVVASCLLLPSTLPACSSDDAPSAEPVVEAGADTASTTLSAEAETFLKSLCAYYEPCCAKVKATTTSTCIASSSELARGLTFDATRATSCLESLAAESKTANANLCSHGPDAYACKAVFKKRDAKPSGTACSLSGECTNASTEHGADGLCIAQKCQQVKRGKEGDACTATIANGTIDAPSTGKDNASVCVVGTDNLYCDPDTSICKARGSIGGACALSIDASCVDTAWCADTKQCSPRTQKDAACTSANECAPGLQCANDGAGNAKCLALEAEGGACIRGDECDARQGLVCSSDTSKCILDPTVYGLACKGSLALL